MRPSPQLFLPLFAVLTTACPQPDPVYLPAPEHLLSATEVPAMPSDPDDPWARLLWTMNYDLREFDDTWTWLESDATPGLERDRSMGAAALLGVAELDRFELLDAGIDSLAAAIAADPEDGRLPAWRAYLVTLKAMRADDPMGVEAGYDAVRAATEAYTSFSLFGVTLMVAGDPNADAALIQEALDDYDRLLVDFGELQYQDDALSRERGSRLGDWASAPFNMPGTQALMGDMAARAGDGERAKRHWYTALRGNEAYRWAFRDEVQARLDMGPEAVAEAIAAGELQPFGARFAGALGTTESFVDPRFEGRVGNGSCTICHTRLGAFDDLGGDSSTVEVGFIRGTIVLPEGVPNPMPNLFALPGQDSTPKAFQIGRIQWDQDQSRDPLPAPEPGSEIEYMIATPPGLQFVAGRIGVDDRVDYKAYTARTIGPPRYVEVKAGQIADITASDPMVFEAAD
ncbi:MAG: hypothetical protein KC457_00205 [Myxococcales bacterium]|nr:hypothetical protein [Myxococcales bacterium]